MSSTSSKSEPQFKTILICGVGLIGGSVALAVKKRDQSVRILGWGRSEGRLKKAAEQGVIDDYSVDRETVAKSADLIVIATPVDNIASEVLQFHAVKGSGCLITDAGSVKGEIVSKVEHVLGGEHQFVPAHPIAGSEKGGFEHADPDLYEGATIVITPSGDLSQAAVNRVSQFWASLGGRMIEMSAQEHDAALARTSHLPHLVASVLAGNIGREDFPLAGSGFRDTTRIAMGDPILWNAIFSLNAEATLEASRQFRELLIQFEAAIMSQDSQRLVNLLTVSKQLRENWESSSQIKGVSRED